ncbi:MAG: hypothetical protein E7588_06415 [Ruminococcaceae bacterium]|nr:hypothetical protein [Oscillospiraceae bacterium]
MFKRILALSFLIFVIALMVSMHAFAAENGVITVEKVEIQQGETVAEVKINVTDNPGLIFAKMNVSFDSSLTLIAVADGGIWGHANHPKDKANPYPLYWNNGTVEEDFTENGTIVTLTFSVPENIVAGVYPINLSVVQNSTFNYDDEDVNFNVVNGSITVKSASKISGEMIGAQMRNDGIAGLRFGNKFNVNNSFLTSLTGGNTYNTLGAVFADGISNVSFGTLVIPVFVLEDNSLTATNLTHALCGDMDVADVPCKNIYDYDSDSFTYTAVVTNIPDKFSGGKIVARGYVKYTENAQTVYHYLDTVTASPEDVKTLLEGVWYKD